MADIEPRPMPEEFAEYFSREEVDGLRSLADSLSSNLGSGTSVSPLLDLADRIAALLRPREER